MMQALVRLIRRLRDLPEGHCVLCGEKPGVTKLPYPTGFEFLGGHVQLILRQGDQIVYQWAHPDGRLAGVQLSSVMQHLYESGDFMQREICRQLASRIEPLGGKLL